MDTNENFLTSKSDQTVKIPFVDGDDDHNRLVKPTLLNKRISCRLTSLILPILLGLLLIIGSVLLVLTFLRLNIRQLQQTEQGESLLEYGSDTSEKTWLACVETNTSTCACPVTYIHSSLNPLHCIPTHSHCLHSCKHNLHCQCYHSIDPVNCRLATRHWIEQELNVGPIENFHKPINDRLLKYTWMDNFNRQFEYFLSDRNTDDSLFLSPNRRIGFAINTQDQDFLLYERWARVEINTTQQQIVYTQLDPQTHTCRMSLLNDDGTIENGDIHQCPSSSVMPPYFFGIACRTVLVLWQDDSRIPIKQQEQWASVNHNYESTMPNVPVLLDPFHRYYSLYPNSTIFVKDLNGILLKEFFTDIEQPTRFEFLDHYRTIWIANKTHMQSFHSTNDQIWLDF